jgi:CRP-like cAMP-binding protein
MPAGSRSKRTQSLTDPSEYEAVVPEIPMLQRLSDGTRKAVAMLMLQISKAYELSPGEVLYERGQEDENTGALLVRGTMRVRRRGGEPIFLEAPEILGEIRQFMKSGIRTATVEAENNVTVLEFSWTDFNYMATELGALKPAQIQEFKAVLKAWAKERLAEIGDDSLERT